MKNSMIKGSHLSEKKCRDIVHFFSEDLTATQIAHITGVSRVTINNYLKLLRLHIAKYCEEKSPLQYSMASGSAIMPSTSEGGAINNITDEVTHAFYGFYCCNGHVLVDWLNSLDKTAFDELPKVKSMQVNIDSLHIRLRKYQAIADFDAWQLYRLDEGNKELDDMVGFWRQTKSRLLKFRGLNKNTLYLHVKESEFRYNHRNDNLNELLLGIIHMRPLHLSKIVSV
jgi:transposase